ncbi:MAG: carboxypeptidase-like regulatory domain-containing protein [Dysgonomonas sp.]|uniref:carboxypeptidase-like regulatory domain-containing protein n=1 Tax=Dysgonomonas sp. TaxID=1891233 RepID=UPI00257AC20E|nr:DUF6705 family protein [Dysgonomonas sp.]MBS7121611.1 carboxypeptidase-like regulatory domain-containing protein [Dysgonomonas sp.]
MIYKILLLIIFTITTNTIVSQNRINGYVVDENDNPLPFSSVILIVNNDSVLINTQTDSEGLFLLENINSGKYILEIYCVGKERKKMQLELYSKDITLNTIRLQPLNVNLNEVITTASPPMKVLLFRPLNDLNDLIQNKPIESGYNTYYSKDSHLDNYTGTWQWMSNDGDSVFIVSIENKRLRSRVKYLDARTRRNKADKVIFHDRDQLLGWYEFRVKDSILVSTMNPKIKIKTINSLTKEQLKVLIGVQVQISSTIAQMFLLKNPSKGKRGFLFFQLLDKHQNLALWNLKVLIEGNNKLGYVVIRDAQSNEFVIPTNVIMKKISSK